MDDKELFGFVSDVWDKDILPTLNDYIRIPNVSPVFEADWAELGHMRRAVDLLADWIPDQRTRQLILSENPRRLYE